MKESGRRDDDTATSTSRLAGAGVLCALADIWEMWQFEKDFFESIAKEMWDDATTNGEDQFIELQKTEALTDWKGEPFVPGFKAAIVQIATMHVACAFATQSMKAEINTPLAWTYACKANHWLGILQGTISGRGMEREIGSKSFSSLGLAKRHAENRAMKASAIAWCDANIANYKSLDKAAEAIAGKELPVSFRTARAWIADWKKLRSTGKL